MCTPFKLKKDPNRRKEASFCSNKIINYIQTIYEDKKTTVTIYLFCIHLCR